MDVCSWDWGAIATFTGTGVALYISKEWRNQKGKEVLANEAKSIINELNLIHEKAHQLQDLLLSGNLEKLKSQIKEFVEDRNNIDLNMNLFNTLVEVNFKEKDIQLEKFKQLHMNATYQLVGKINTILEKDNNFIYENQGIIIDERGRYQDFNIQIKHYIANYAVYKNPKSA